MTYMRQGRPADIGIAAINNFVSQTASTSASASPTPQRNSETAAGGGDGISARFFLRAETQPDHLATERAFEHLDLSREAGYAAFLRAHCAALASIEPHLSGRGWQHYSGRLCDAMQDLAGLGQAVHDLPSQVGRQPLADPEVWGAQYVIEGSRLGGRVLRERIPASLPSCYLADNPNLEHSWRAFCGALDEQAVVGGSQWLFGAKRGAKRAFAEFQRAANSTEPTERD